MALTRAVRSLGGKARAKKLSKRRRREIASLGGQAIAKAVKRVKELEAKLAKLEGSAA